eukprot:TRINITY_DN110875_c0_g1_i1.p1 TRINITY_DN110875_c0_g1~~TRINITY_DN110875_c0_g1_i1.p1  ORF type:complete len:522 (+),score=112.32 TRINITY_DN110875_c0_g1_i1:188-1753(+)
MSGQQFVVKNTFLEVGDHKSLLERSDGWRRQMSEPVKVFTGSGPQFPTQQDTLSELTESDDDLEVADIPGQKAYVETTDVTISAPPGSGLNASPPQVLRLSESIPPQRLKQESREAAPKDNKKDSYINSIKNNDITKKLPPWTNVTTVMMRNLPNKYTQQMLLEELADGGFRVQHDFDFIYLPMDHTNAANLGYCFINFVQTALANGFAAAFQGKKMRRFNSNKTVVVMPASIQGFERNYAYYSSTRVAQAEDPAYRPLFLRSSTAVPGKPAASPGTGKAASAGVGGGKGSKQSSSRSGDANTNGAPGGKASKKGNKKDGAKAKAEDSHQQSEDHSGFMAAVNMNSLGMAPMVGMMPGGCMAGGQFAANNGHRVCPSCGNDVAPAHRFCAFCGNFVGPQAAPSFSPDALAFGQSGLARSHAHGAADVSALAAQLRGVDGASFEPSAFQQQVQSALNRHSESVTDELDVMRGREMLLAALKDMESRDGGARGAYASQANYVGLPFGGMCDGLSAMPQVATPW